MPYQYKRTPLTLGEATRLANAGDPTRAQAHVRGDRHPAWHHPPCPATAPGARLSADGGVVSALLPAAGAARSAGGWRRLRVVLCDGAEPYSTPAKSGVAPAGAA